MDIIAFPSQHNEVINILTSLPHSKKTFPSTCAFLAQPIWHKQIDDPKTEKKIIISVLQKVFLHTRIFRAAKSENQE